VLQKKEVRKLEVGARKEGMNTNRERKEITAEGFIIQVQISYSC